MLGFIAFPGGNRETNACSDDGVTAWLAGLPANYDVFHDVETSAGHLEHLVVSFDRGVFLIETRAGAGRVSVEDGNLLIDGSPPVEDRARALARKALWLRQALADGTGVAVPVIPILVFTQALVTDACMVGSVVIAGADDLDATLSHTHSRGRSAVKFWAHRECIGALCHA